MKGVKKLLIMTHLVPGDCSWASCSLSGNRILTAFEDHCAAGGSLQSGAICCTVCQMFAFSHIKAFETLFENYQKRYRNRERSESRLFCVTEFRPLLEFFAAKHLKNAQKPDFFFSSNRCEICTLDTFNLTRKSSEFVFVEFPRKKLGKACYFFTPIDLTSFCTCFASFAILWNETYWTWSSNTVRKAH